MRDPVLDYALPPVDRQFPWRRCFLFLLLAGVVAAVVWWRADWGVYVDEGPGRRWRKFELPLWVQITLSTIAGLFTSGVAFGIERIVRRVTRRERSR